jgi:hypothetical protein
MNNDTCPSCGRCPTCGATPDPDGPDYGPGDAGTRRTEDRGRWMKGAKRELALLIREIEGPNPRPAPRNTG